MSGCLASQALKGGSRGRQKNTENPRSRQRSKTKDRRNKQRSTSKIRRDEDERGLSDQFETITFQSITVNATTPHARPTNEVFVTVNVDLHSSSRPPALKAKLDPGAQGNLLPLRLYRRMYPQNLTPEGFPNPGAFEYSPIVVTTYEGAMLRQHGKCQYHITVDPFVPPVVHAQRRVPLSLRDDIQNELADMESRSIIAKIKESEPTAWVNSLVYLRKPNGKLGTCLDLKDLNKAIRREHRVTPTPEEILRNLAGAKFFSIGHAKCGYWNVELDEESIYLTTFNSPFGRYRCLRMPFGLKMSQDIFQANIDQTFEGCKDIIAIADDIVVHGKLEEEQDKQIREMLLRCRTTGLKLNPDKCKIKQQKTKFYGVICVEDGVEADPERVSALKKMAPPTTKQKPKTFID
ncbi:Uncharacterized protein K02A2.6 [Stylophora pistillata]|uniref:Uncharacterized protein K02A2.6 n=1 Tax=Stylophora pistillata TaxID=50429 RepID=A0A2B4RN07_STYPI|nr:Uncharacterized protein K02A2.6 [Stylophora pistillata]